MRTAVFFASAAIVLSSSGVARAQVHVACVGDSITAGIGASSPYPAQLQALLGAGYAVENDGYSGATMLKAGDLPYWTTGAFTRSTAWSSAGGDVVIQLGTNDSKPSNWNKASFLSDCEALVDHYRASPTTRVWISLVPPATASACCKISGAAIESEIIPALKTCAANRNATAIDVHAALAPYPQYLTDGVHPNDAGAALIAQTVHAALSRAPSITLSASEPSSPAPASITLTATPAAAYGKVEKVRFFDGATLVKEISAPPWSFTVTGVAAGSHAFTAEVMETAGRTKTSSTATINVAPGATPEDASAPSSSASGSSSGPSSSSSSSSSGGAGCSPSPPSSPAPSTDEQGVAEDHATSSESGCASTNANASSAGVVALLSALAILVRRRRSEERWLGGRDR